MEMRIGNANICVNVDTVSICVRGESVGLRVVTLPRDEQHTELCLEALNNIT